MKENLQISDAEVMRLIKAIGSQSVDRDMNDDKEEIYVRTVMKIRNGAKSKSLFLHLCAAVISLFLIGTAIYTVSRITGEKKYVTNVQSMLEVSVPYGVMTKITLPDGSSAILNGGSKLTYPSTFQGNREVSLTGEGYFDVVKDRTTFKIHTSQMSVNVLGTRFSIKSYDEDKYVMLTLEEGSVRAETSIYKDILLEPGCHLKLNRETGYICKEYVDVKDYISWKDGVLTFKDLCLGDIAHILERHFNVTINISSDEIRNERYVAQFKHGENIWQIIDKLSYKRKWKYVIRNNIIVIH